MKTNVERKASAIIYNIRKSSLGCGMVLWLCVPLISLGQSSEDFRYLIFEPAAVPQDEAQLENPRENLEGPQQEGPQQEGPQQEVPQSPQLAGATSEANPQAAPPTAAPISAAETTTDTEIRDAQPGDDTNLQNEIRRYEEALNASLQNQDQYSQQLREQYETLGRLLQQNGEHERAIAMFESAMQIDRINTGLFTTLQIPLVERIIESQNALGKLEEVADMQGYLYYIHQKSFAADSEELLAAKEAWADWNVESYVKEGGNGLTGNYRFYGRVNSAAGVNDYVPIQNPRTGEYSYVPRSQLPFILSPAAGGPIDLYRESSPYAVNPEKIIDDRLRTAEELYEEILETREGQNADSANSAVQHKLANIAFAIKRQMEVLESQTNQGSLGFNGLADQSQPNILVRRRYAKNLEALEAIAEDLEKSPDASPVAKATAYINVGDWNISFDRAQRGEAAYVKAWEILRDASFSDSEIAGIFQPQPLVPVPAYAIHEFSRAFYGFSPDVEIERKGYIDTTVNLDRFGGLSNIRIGATSPDTARGVRDTLLTYLRNKKMRPTIVDGKLVTVSDVKTRYYYSYE